ncbi:Adaptin N terminal region family protein [Histomonas meleagridis]|uniref:Adaptin N terminal region family protein n=1 Tax=Histomonas meleagridis TaxID=135588 RepID=UPI00355A9271|nr:Adaptin N terminal region family protein [Histomonas meleagridis]KAH0801407.1 Adaptin N terminal region family protein [Histomonas meleagridis]
MSFAKTTKNDILLLRDKLTSSYPKERKEAVSAVISKMRAGENVQPLFSDMLCCAKTNDLELKKLVYLYLVSYSSTEPEQSIMIVNTFIQDAVDENPLVRALAVRTMCRIKIESVAEHMIVPLKKALQDEHPYVRKTAAISVVKLYEIIPEAIENSNIFPELIKLLHDENPMVVSNTTAALLEINEHRSSPIFRLTQDTVSPILAALTSSTEWCQALLLDALSKSVPSSQEDASFLIDRLIPMLKNTNPAVVVGAFKCIFLFMDYDTRKPRELFPIILPPFITLITSSEYEIQYLVLRTLSLFVQKYKRALSKEICIFFCKYNDPSYVKMEKLDIIVTICTEETAQIVLDELSEYCNGVDVSFVRKSVRSIGQIAIRIPKAANLCVDILVTLVNGKAEYAIEESVIVVSDILRRFPGSFESVIAAVCQNIDQLNSAESKAAAIWILGEYCNVINNVDVILDPFLDTFIEEPSVVQLQLLTAFVKLYLYKPEQTKDLLQCILNEATKNDVNPDVRNRGFIYWRLLSSNGNIAKDVIIFDKIDVEDSGIKFDDNVLSELIRNMGTVSGVLHIVPSDFVNRICNTVEDNINSSFLNFDDSKHYVKVPLKSPNSYEATPIELYIDFDQNSMFIKIVNLSNVSLKDLAIALNKNPIGLTFATTPSFPSELKPNETTEIEIPIIYSSDKLGNFESGLLDVALRISPTNTVFANINVPLKNVILQTGRIDKEEFRMKWANMNQSQNCVIQIDNIANEDALRERNVFVIAQNNNKTYISFMVPPNVLVMAEIVEDGNGNANILFKADDLRIGNYLRMNFQQLLQA